MKIEEINFKGKKALIRVDFNVPFNDDYIITEPTRISSTKKTIFKVLEQGGAVILMSHMGRPKGSKVDELSFSNLSDQISELIGLEVNSCTDCIGPKITEAAQNLEMGQLMLLENLRFYKEEEEGDEEFAKKLADLADVYINDAFGTAHRAHASTSVISQFFEEKCFGYLMEDELKAVDSFFNLNKKPVTAIIGGAKVSSKIHILENLFPVVDNILIGGGMSYTFIKAKQGNVGNSLIEEDYLEKALQILKKAEKENVKIYLPEDSVLANKFDENGEMKVSYSNEINEGWMGLDIGPKAVEEYSNVIKESKTILWNGPMGVFEFDAFANGTNQIAKAALEATKKGSYSLIGGGDSVAAVKKLGLMKDFSYVSTGGGAMLEALEGKTLPGVAAMLS